MADNFTFTWNDGSVTSVPLPSETGFDCDHTSPSGTMNNAANQIVLHAGDTTSANSHEIEEYCEQAQPVLMALYQTSKSIYEAWYNMERACQSWRCDAWCGCCGEATRYCRYKGRYCYMTNGELDSAYASWKAIRNSNLANVSNIEEIWQEASDQITLDGQQATNQAILDQLIATTNTEISLAAYQNEVLEIDAAVKKTNKIFAPLLIGIVVIGLGFYFYKK